MTRLYAHLSAPTSIVPLVVLRVVMGGLLCLGMLRFLAMGWVEALYVVPQWHFTYYGFGWVRPLPEPWLTAVYAVLALLALGIALGLCYRLSVGLFLLGFVYTELLDKTYYLNHYYFVTLVLVLLLLLPAHRAWSCDAWHAARSRSPARRVRSGVVPAWVVWAVRIQIGLVYVFAGIAKLKADWLLHALPLRIWLLEHTGFPLIGHLFAEEWFAYLMSWGGALYDLTIPLLLVWGRTRPLAYLAVVGFHMMTALLFPIGMFPWLMIGCSLVFLERRDWQWLGQHVVGACSRLPTATPTNSIETAPGTVRVSRMVAAGVALLLVVQLVVPFRHLAFPGDVTWNEAGFRFAWNVMLVEKTGHALFRVRDPASGQAWDVFPETFLTTQQAKQMAFQPDMLHEFAHMLEAHYRQHGYADVEIRAEVYVSLNGRASRLLVDPAVDLTQQPAVLGTPAWVLP